MENLFKNITSVFEFLLRWIYPGFLFLILLYFGDAEFKKYINNLSNEYYNMIILVVVSSFIIYVIHRYILHEIILYILYRCHITAPGEFAKKGHYKYSKIRYYDCLGEFLSKRYENQDDRTVSSIQFRWAVTHTMGVTGWLLIFMKYKYDLSTKILDEKLILILGITLLIGWLHQVIILSRAECQSWLTKNKNESKAECINSEKPSSSPLSQGNENEDKPEEIEREGNMSEDPNKNHLIELYKMYDEERRFRIRQEWTFVVATFVFFYIIFELGTRYSTNYIINILGLLISIPIAVIACFTINRIHKIYEGVKEKMDDIAKVLNISEYLPRIERKLYEVGFGTYYFMGLIILSEIILIISLSYNIWQNRVTH